jgi:dCMP deaminase
MGKNLDRNKLEKYIKNIKEKEYIKKKIDDWDDYFMELLQVIKQRSSCIHRKVGAVIVRNNRILATGYNQPPSGFPHCDIIPCIRDELDILSGENQEICFAAHAEQNAITQAARFGISTEGAKIYVTHKPCSVCARLIINSGINEVIFMNDYPDALTDYLFSTSKIKYRIYQKSGG